MTTRTFLQELKKLNPRFKMNRHGEIRSKSGACPVCYLANRRLHKHKFTLNADEAGEYLGLDPFDTDNIVDAADWSVPIWGDSTKIRKDLLKMVQS